MIKHIIFQGPKDSGKTTAAKELGSLLFSEKEIGYKDCNTMSLMGYINAIRSGIKLLIIDECPDAAGIVAVAAYIEGFNFEMKENVSLIFITQANCSFLPSDRWRIISCSYSISREEYIKEPITP